MCGSLVGFPTSDTTHYKQDHGDALYRRSMYTYWKRMAMPPDMEAFDAPHAGHGLYPAAAHRHTAAGIGNYE